ncbi:MAG: hypothetical protein COT89_00330 [Candidatus Colwellbacteria bacterium CG10_big_fil_rev_8_21_14_0_10_42_22]|uniref:Four helix bundle protein n=1 Tax=Candidatus Colwellbacteria bacterium CG10_big_fil_rev_8_21_14_0_10_42_22 TaxID=1974540 RepID=A0A2H0VIT0_9BACT|nr:MAG: hypothetical protein COT89_00330 [Candidatus Colwellbacteria bacterium CG10_big_fil_rev_8_21_14_0_10_42_22]
MNSYKELIVWQKAVELVELVYLLLQDFPKEEMYGLTSQIKRATVSIASNIAEGSNRGTRKDFRNFLFNAFGSGAELETQLLIAQKLNFVSPDSCKKTNELLEEIMKMLNKLISELAERT